jgi:hypothetical protein
MLLLHPALYALPMGGPIGTYKVRPKEEGERSFERSFFTASKSFRTSRSAMSLISIYDA